MNYEELREEFILDQDWTPDTVSWGRRQLVIFGEYLVEKNIGLGEMTSGQFTRLLTKMRNDGKSWSSRNGLYNVVSPFHKWLYQNGHIEINIFANADTSLVKKTKRS